MVPTLFYFISSTGGGTVGESERDMKKFLFFCLLGLFFCLNGNSQIVTHVELRESGTLLDLLSDSEIERTEKIIITGNSLNASDFSVLKAMLVKHQLTEVDIENTTTNFVTKNAFDGCLNLEKIKLPKYLINIDYMAFGNCRNLKSIILPSSLKEIESGAFWFCTALESITLGRKLVSIKGDCFRYSGLKEVHCKGTVPSDCKYGAFEGLHQTCILYVPEGYKKAYSFADGWLNFENIREEYVEPANSLQVDLQGGTFVWQLYPDYEGIGGAVVKSIYPKEKCFIEVEKGETVVFHIAEEYTYFFNWKVDSILLNGKDITSDLTENQLLYITINQNSKLEIIMKDLIATSNDSIEKSNVVIKVLSNGLYISNVSPNEQIKVYNLSGVLIHSKKVDNNNCEIQLPGEQIYFVQVGGEIFKIKK